LYPSIPWKPVSTYTGQQFSVWRKPKFNEMTYFNGVQESVADILKHYGELGWPMSYTHMAAGWVAKEPQAVFRALA